MRYITILLLISVLFMFGCGIKASKNHSAGEQTGTFGQDGTDREESLAKRQTEAVYLGDSLYLLLEDGRLDESHLVRLDTGENEFENGTVIVFDMVERTEGLPFKAKAENVSLSDREVVKQLKITFDAAYAIKEFLGERAALVDVRTPEEYAQGHAKGAELIPLDEIEAKVQERFKKDEIISLYCRSGNRSATAQAVLEDKGYFVLDIGGIGDYKGDIER